MTPTLTFKPTPKTTIAEIDAFCDQAKAQIGTPVEIHYAGGPGWWYARVGKSPDYTWSCRRAPMDALRAATDELQRYLARKACNERDKQLRKEAGK